MKVEDVRVFRSKECGSDHRLLLAKIFAPWRRRKTRTLARLGASENTECRKYKLHLLNDESVRNLFKNRLEAKLDVNHEGTATENYESLKRAIHEAAAEALGTLGEVHTPEWWSEEVAELISRKKEAYNKWLASGDNDTWISYRRLNREVKEKVREEKDQSWERCCQRLDGTLGFNRVRESWGVLRSLRTPRKGNLVSVIEDQAWVDYYSELLKETRSDFIQEAREARGVDEDRIEVTTEEVRQAVVRGRNGKAPGPGGIPIELLKAGGDKLVLVLTDILNKILGGQELPFDLRLGYLSSIFKKGDRRVCGNYRGICVQSSVSRVMGRILRDRLEAEYVTPQEQAGFTAERSCTDNIFVLRQIIEKCNAKQKELHMAFIDLEKAYDSVPRQRMWDALRAANVSEGLIRAIQLLYTADVYKVKVGNRLSHPFGATKGLKQGCCLSPFLFKVYLQYALKDWFRKCRKLGVPVVDSWLVSLFFADDQVVFERKKSDLEELMKCLQEEYSRSGLKINFSKTEYMPLVTKEDLGDLKVGNETCAKVDVFKYLGSLLDRKGTSELEVRGRTEQARKAVRMLHPVLWKSDISSENKRRIFRVIVEGILTYASETWTMNPQLYSRVQAVEMDYWRRCIGVTRLDRVRNDVVREAMGVVETVNQRIGARRLRWYGHCKRMNAERWPRTVMEWTPGGRRGRGRPRATWMDGVREEMAGRGLSDGDWEDRRLWASALAS